MQDQLRILTCIIAQSVKKHGKTKTLTLGHLLNICKLASKWEAKLDARSEKEHQQLMEDINPLGQD